MKTWIYGYIKLDASAASDNRVQGSIILNF